MTDRTRKRGPKTPEGKARSSMNALKHGLYAVTSRARQQVAEEAGVDFDTILEQMRRHFQPADPLEMQLVRRIARCTWRLALAEAMERNVLDRQVDARRPSSSYDRILKYERLVDIHLHRAVAALQHKRCLENKEKSPNELSPRSVRA